MYSHVTWYFGSLFYQLCKSYLSFTQCLKGYFTGSSVQPGLVTTPFTGDIFQAACRALNIPGPHLPRNNFKLLYLWSPVATYNPMWIYGSECYIMLYYHHYYHYFYCKICSSSHSLNFLGETGQNCENLWPVKPPSYVPASARWLLPNTHEMIEPLAFLKICSPCTSKESPKMHFQTPFTGSTSFNNVPVPTILYSL